MKKLNKLIKCVFTTITIVVWSWGLVSAQTSTYYKEVKIGDQIWMTENLNVDKFRNGDIIPQAATSDQWIKAGNERKPAWCYYDNDRDNGAKYGKLYNWYALSDPRGLAPKGWHIPSNKEWDDLIINSGGEKFAGNKLKTYGSEFWNDYNRNATNENGFSALPGGVRYKDGTFVDVGGGGYFWTSSEFSSEDAWLRILSSKSGFVSRIYTTKKGGQSIRCLKN